MDPLSQFLTGPRAQSAFTLRVVMEAPFSIDVQDEAALTVIVAVSGKAWITAAGSAPRSLSPGQAATVRGPAPYYVTDTPGRAPTVVIDAGQSCLTPAGEHLELTMSHGVRTWGNSPDGATVLLIGTYQTAAAAGQLVTSALPALAVFDSEGPTRFLLKLLERSSPTPGWGRQAPWIGPWTCCCCIWCASV